MSKPTYYELLKHPNWQRKRLEILQRANFECENCGATESTLHVHHTYYEKGLKPWEYPDASLHALCEQCHSNAGERMRDMQQAIGRLGLSLHEQVIGYMAGLEARHVDREKPINVWGYETAEGIGDAFGLTAEQVIDAQREGIVTAEKLESLKAPGRR